MQHHPCECVLSRGQERGLPRGVDVPSGWVVVSTATVTSASQINVPAFSSHYAHDSHVWTPSFLLNLRVSSRSHTLDALLPRSAPSNPAFTSHRSTHANMRNAQGNMLVIWNKISHPFRRTPSALVNPIQSPVTDLPYDEAVESTASMIEEWKKKQPPLPDDLEVLVSAVSGSVSCTDCLCRSGFRSQK